MGIGRDVLLQIRLLLESSQYKPALDKAVTDTESAAKRMADAHGNASQDMQGEVGKLIAKLSEQNATFGMSEAQLRRYRAEQVAMSEAQRAATNALLDNLEAMEAQASAGGLARLAASAGALATAATAAAAVVVTAAAGVAAAYHFAGQETLAYEKAIILSGNAAGVTSGQLADMARRIDGVAGTQANAAAALATMTASGKVAAENLEKVSLAAIEMERATGQSVGDTEKIFAKLGDDPVKASQRLNESMHFLTASTYAQIKAADELGDKEAAASIAQNAAADALRQRAAQVEQQLGLLERAWRGVRDVAKQAWDNMLNVGRPDTLSTQIADLRSKIDQAKGKDPNRRFSMPWDTPLADLEQQLAYLTEQDRLIRRGTEAQAERNRVQAAGIAAVDALGKANDSAMTRQERAAKALDAYRDSLKAVRAAHEQAPSDALGKLLDPETIARTEAAILKQGEASVRATKASLSEYDKLVQRLNTDLPAAAAQSQAAQQGYNKAQTEFLVLAGSPTWAKFTNDQRAAVAVLYEQKIAREQVAQATEAEQKAALEAAKARDKALSTGEKELDKLRAMVTAQEEQNARLGLSKEAVADLDAAKLEMMATDLELQAIKALDRNLDEQQYELLKKQAQAYRDLAQAKRDGAARQAAVESERELERTADKAAREGERAAARIEQSLTDALMRGFESGKDFAQNLRDTVVNMFKTMVLRPVISAIISPVAGAITGALGLSSAAQAGQGISGVSTAISGASLLGRLGAFGGGMSAGFGGLMGSLGLSATGSTLGGAMSAGSIALGSGNILGGLGTFAGALGPIALGIGLVSSLFSRKLKDQGIQGTLGGEAGFEGQQYRFYKGGLFRSDKTKYSAIDPELERMLAGSFGAVQDRVTDFAEALSLPTDRIKGFTTDIKVSFNGLDEAGIQKALQDALATGSNELAQQVLGTLTTTTREVTETLAGDWGDGTMQTVTRTIEETTYAASEYAREGEQAIDTLARLATSVTTVNDWFELLGLSLYEASLQGADAASNLADLFGGLVGFSAAASTYYENFYSEAEKAANVTRDVTAALADVGLQMPATREGFRALVEQQVALGESGAQAVATLLSVSGAFASVTAASETAAEAAARLADEQAKAAKEAQDAYRKQAQAAQDAADAARRAQEELLEALTKAAEQALEILGNAIDAEKKVQQAEYDAQMVIIDAQRKASTTFVEAQRAWLNVAIDSTKNYANALESEAARIRGFFTGMVLQDDPDAPAGASVFSAQAALRAGDTSDAVLRKATDIDPEMFSSWADYAINFFDTKSLVDQYATQAERAASVAASDVALLEQQLTKAEEQYQADLDHYTRLEGIAKDTLEANILRLDGILQAARDQLAEAAGTKLAVMGLGAALGNFAGAVTRLSDVTRNPVTTPLSTTAPVLTTYGTADRADAFVAQVTAYNPVISGATSSRTNNQVVDVLREVVAELQALRTTGADTRAAVEKTTALLDQVTGGGNAMLTETA